MFSLFDSEETRHGPTGTVELQFDGPVTRFSSLARANHLPERI